MKNLLIGIIALASFSGYARENVVLYTGDYIGSFSNTTAVPKDYTSELKEHLELSGYNVVKIENTRNSNLFPYGMDGKLDQIARKHDAKIVSFLSIVPYLPNNKGNISKVSCAMSLEIRNPAPVISEQRSQDAQAQGVIIIPHGITIFKTALGTEFHKTLNFNSVCNNTFDAIIESLPNP